MERCLLFHFILISIIAVLPAPNLAVASSPPGKNGVHFCGVTEQQPDNRRYARTLANLDVGEPYTVRIIHFFPSDRAVDKDMDTKLDTLIKRVQRFFADEMERQGFGRKTFKFETDGRGNAVVHRVRGSSPGSYYVGDANLFTVADKVLPEIYEQFARGKVINFIVTDAGRAFGGFGNGASHGGEAFITVLNCGEDEIDYFNLAAHELGHAFGLPHDFRNEAYIMSYGSRILVQLSKCDAEWLDVHRYFNTSQTSADTPATIQMLPPFGYPPNAIRLRFTITDADGIHQARLIGPLDVGTPYGSSLIACKRLNGQSKTVEFITTDLSFAQGPNSGVSINVIDVNGNMANEYFAIREEDVRVDATNRVDINGDGVIDADDRKPATIQIVSGDNQHGLPNSWLEEPFVVQVRDAAGEPVVGIEVAFRMIRYGTLSAINPRTDSNGQAQSFLRDKRSYGPWQVEASVAGVDPVVFNATFSPQMLVSPSYIPPMFWISEGSYLQSFFNDGVVGAWVYANSVASNVSRDGKIYLTHEIFDDRPACGTIHRSNSEPERVFLSENVYQFQLGAEDLAVLTHAVPLGITIDTMDGKLYWTTSRGNIQHANIDGSNIQDLIAGLDSPEHIGVDTVGGKLYWTEMQGLIRRANLNGSNIETFASGLGTIGSITVVGKNLYWTEKMGETQGKISRANLSGRNTEALVTLSSVPVGIAIDSARRKVYWTDTKGRIRRADLDGSNVEDVVIGLVAPGNLVLVQKFSAEGARVAKTLQIVSGNDQEGQPRTALENPFVVEVRDQSDKPLPGVHVTFTVAGGGGRLSATSITTDSNGRAESILTLGPNPGTNTVTVFVEGIQGQQTFTAEGIRIPEALETVSGNDQQGLPGATLEKPFVAEVRDQSDKPLPGVAVAFSVSGGGGSLSVTTATTDSNGRAESTLTLGPKPGTNTVTVSVTGIQDRQLFTAEGVRIPETLEMVSGDDQQGLPGAVLEKPFVVEVRDQSGKPLSGVQVTFSVTNGGGTLSATSVTTDSNGRAESILTLGPNPGTNTVTVFVEGIQEQQTFTAEGIRIPEALETVSGNDQQGLPAAPLENPFVVEVRDQSDKPLPGVHVTFTVAGGGGRLSATSITTDSNGRAESILTLGPNPGTNTVTVFVEGIQEQQTFTAEGIRIPEALETVSGNDQQGLPGATLEKPFVAEVRDQSDKPLPGVAVAFSVSGGGGSLSVTTATTDSNGRAESVLTLGLNPGMNTVIVSVEGIQEEQTFTAEGIRIPKALETVSGNGQQGRPGTALEKPFVAEVRDQLGEPLPDVQVTFSVTQGGGTLSVTSTATNSNGRAESTLTLGPEPGTNTVTVSVAGIKERQSFTAEGIRIPLAFWIITGFDQNGTVGEALAAPFVVEVRGRSGEPFPDAEVTFSITQGGGTLSVTSTVTDTNGRAESILTLGPNPGMNMVTVSVAGIKEAQTVTAVAEPPPIPQDVNRDDVVNILDLVLVASVLGDEGKDLTADVNEDGVVNILDLVFIAGALGNAAAAPSAWYRDLEIAPTRPDVVRWLAQAGELDLTDTTSQRGVLFLEQLLATLIPKETALLPNYPNPFNPETWIPFKLAKDADVTLSIYDANGIMVRRLELGHRLAGYYSERGRATYWDGLNGFGERVASGVYFYHLSAGYYSATRKMFIIK